MKRILLIFLTCFSFSYFSQTAWDLEQCIAYALKHNISLRQSAITNEINKNNSDQSKAAILPSINAGANHVYNFGKTIDRFTNKFADQRVLSQSFFLSSNVVLWSGLSQYNNMKGSEYVYLSGIEQLKQQENDLSLAVANAYIGVIFAEEFLKISKNQYAITKEQLERTQKLVNAGSLAKSVEYDIKAQLANEEVNVTTAENGYQLSMLNLTQLMNYDSVAIFNIAKPDLSVQESQLLESNLNGVYETALKNQPGIKSADYSIKSSEKFLAANRGRYGPTLSLNATIGTGTSELAKDVLGFRYLGIQPTGDFTRKGDTVYSAVIDPITKTTPFTDQFKNNVNRSVGFTLSFPLFNGLQTHTSVKNAKLGLMTARFNQDLVKQTLYKNIVQAVANAKAALNKYNATKLSVDAANESFKYAQQKFSAGVISSFDFNSAKNRLFAAESNLLQSKYDYVFKLKVLDYYQGKALGF